MVEWLAGNRIIGTTAERPTASLQSPNVGGWKELDRTTLDTTGDTISVTSLDNKRYYMVLTSAKASGTLYPEVELNGDTGNNYAFRRTINGGTNGTPNGGNNAGQYTALFPSNTDVANGETYFAVDYLSNLSGKEKLAYSCDVFSEADGAGYAPTRQQFGCKWVPTTASDVINRIDRSEYASGEYLADSEVVVLGWDPTDTHTDNFWGELYSNELSTNNQEFSTGTISAKKYLWLQFYQQGHTGNSYLKFNNATGYSRRHEINGADDANVTSQSQLTNVLTGGTGDSQSFTNMFIINDSSKEKLCMFNTVFNAGGTTGAGNAPQKINGVCKWANTSDSITSVQVTDNGGAGFDIGSSLKIWGSD